MDLTPSIEPGGEYPMTNPTDWPEPAADLTIAHTAWAASKSYDKGGPTVARALFDAIVQLEAEARKHSD